MNAEVPVGPSWALRVMCGLNCCRRMECFETEHGSCDPFVETMVLCDDIVKIFRLDDPTNALEFEDDIEALQAGKISTTLVDGNALWDIVGANSTLENRGAAAVSLHFDSMKSTV